MKTSTKLLVAGLILLAIGITFVISGAWVFRDANWELGWKPNFALFVPGLFLSVLSFAPILISFSPKIAKTAAKLHNEALDNAGTEIGTVMQKTATIASPATTTIAKSVRATTVDIETELKKLNDLKSKKVITEDEYNQMRNKLLGLDKK